MKNVTIKSHLTALEWKASWEDKVIEDTQENMKAYQMTDSFWGHFTSEDEFILVHHREGEIRGMSLTQYFTGKVEKAEHGCTITGTFGKKRTANLFLGFGAILCILAIIGSLGKDDSEVLIVSCVLLLILVIIYFVKPSSGQKIIMEHLNKISFDDSFHNKRPKGNYGKKKKKKGNKGNHSNKSMHQKAAMVKPAEESELGVGVPEENKPADEAGPQNSMPEENRPADEAGSGDSVPEENRE